MIVGPARVAAFLQRPDPALGAALFFGPDRGLVRERSDRLLLAVGGDPADPFRTVDLAPGELRQAPAALLDEAAALGFTAGRRCVRVREAADSIAEAVRLLLASTTWDSFVLVEAGELPKRSVLRHVFETSPRAAAVACYEDDPAALRGVIAESLAATGLRADAEATALLIDCLGADRAVSRRELEKLALYKRGADVVTAADVIAVIADSQTATLSETAFAAASGDRRKLERALRRGEREGLEAVGLVRAAAGHLERLLVARREVDRGRSVAEAVGALRPQVFFRALGAFTEQVERWSAADLAAGLFHLTEVEVQCKTTGAPQRALAAQALFRLARMAARRPRASHRPR